MPFLETDEYLALPRGKEAWLVEPILPVGGSLLLYGEPKAGKTYGAIQLAMSLTTGEDWIGFPVRQKAKVAYIQVDTPPGMWTSDEGMYLSRLKAAGRLPRGIYWMDKTTVPFFPFKITDPQHAAALKADLDKIKPDVVIFDVLREIHQGDENKSDDMQKTVAALAEVTLPAAIVLVHHSKKSNPEYGADPRNDMRGGYISGRVDTIVSFATKGKSGDVRMSYFGRALPDGHQDLTRDECGLFNPPDDGIERIVESLLQAHPDTSERELARILHASLPDRTEGALRMMVRRKRPGRRLADDLGE